MDFHGNLGLGIRYCNQAKVVGIVFSFLTSSFLRVIPILMVVHVGDGWQSLYLIHLWIGMDLVLVALFAFWGFIGVSLSCLVTSFFHPLFAVHPIVFAALQSIVILAQVSIFYSNLYGGFTDEPLKDYTIMILVANVLALVSTNLLVLILGRILSFEYSFELLLISLQMMVAVFLTGFPSLYILNRRRRRPDLWTSDWFLLLLRGPNRRPYSPIHTPQLAPGRAQRVARNHHQQRPAYPVQETPVRVSCGSPQQTEFVMISTSGEILCPSCGTSNWTSRNRCRRCQREL